MTPEEARELLIQAKCEQVTHKGYRDALHVVSGLRYEYGVTYRGVNHGGEHIDWLEPTVDERWDKQRIKNRLEENRRLPNQTKNSVRLVRRLVSEPEVIK